MNILNCESINSTYESLESIGIPKEELKEFLYNFDMEEYYNTYNYGNTGDHLLFDLINYKYKPEFNFDFTYWFHLTRTYEFNSFNEGILPLNENINRIWDYLYTLLKDDFTHNVWERYRSDLEHDNLDKRLDDMGIFHYKNKIGKSLHWGPYAMLIRDVAFKSKEMGNHDYLNVPEIIEDICSPFDTIHNYNLLDKFIKNTKPCIIQFKHSTSKSYYLGPILFYLYSIHHNRGLSIHSNMCFNGNGVKIPQKDILNVEYL
jgi:hypothetical protein